MRAAGLASIATSVLVACATQDPDPVIEPDVAARAAGNEDIAPELDASGVEIMPGQVIVKLAAPIEDGKPVVVAGHKLTPVTALPDGAWLMSIGPTATKGDLRTPGRRTTDAIAALRGDAGVVYAHADLVLRFSWEPSDPYYARQWSYPQIGLPSAWEITRGSSNVRIAVFDSGSTPHLDLPFVGGRDFVDGTGPTDVGAWHHGTHVAGIVGARTNAVGGIGGAGICSGCTMIPVRLTGSDGALVMSRLELALGWAAGDQHGGVRQAEIVTLSMNTRDRTSCETFFPDLAAAVQHATARGVVVVNSAGNFNEVPHIPANCPTLISVAATQQNQTLAVYSDRGARIDLAAPGGAGVLGTNGNGGGGYGPGLECSADPTLGTLTDSVLSTWAVYPVVSPAPGDLCYRYLSGTSMAAPHVAATVGLMLSAKPASVTFTPAQILRILTLTAQPISCAAAHTCGAGLLDAGRAVRAAQHGSAPVLVAAPPSIAFGAVTVGATAAASVTVTNTGVGPLVIAGTPAIQITGANAAQFELGLAGCNGVQSCAQSIVVSEGGSTAIPVRCHPSAAGSFAATLVVHSDALGGDASIPLSCVASVPPASQLVLSASALGFPRTHLGNTAAAQPLTISNAGNAVLTFTATTPSPFEATCSAGCACSGATCSGAVAPGGSAVLSVSYTATAIGAQSATLAISSNDPARPSAGVGLSGIGGIGTGAITPASTLVFGNVQVGGAVLGALVVANIGSFPLSISAMDLADAASFTFAYPSGPCANTAHCAQPLPPLPIGGSVGIPVRCHPQTVGPHSSAITLTTDGSPAQVTATLSCTGVVPHLVVTPTSLELGAVRVGASASAELAVANTTSSTALAFSVSQGSPHYRLACAAGCTCADDVCSGTVGATPARLVVTFAPVGVGPATANITFVTDDPAAVTRTVTATGTGTGPVFHRVEPADGELALAAVTGATSPPSLVRIANTGTADLHIASATFTGDAAAALHLATIPATVAPGATVDFAVTCTPSWRAGTQTAQLGFTADAGTTTIIDVACTAVSISGSKQRR